MVLRKEEAYLKKFDEKGFKVLARGKFTKAYLYQANFYYETVHFVL